MVLTLSFSKTIIKTNCDTGDRSISVEKDHKRVLNSRKYSNTVSVEVKLSTRRGNLSISGSFKNYERKHEKFKSTRMFGILDGNIAHARSKSC